MTSWRETTTQQTQDDFDQLVNAVLPFAQHLLAKHGEFYPFGAVTTTDGEVRSTAAELGDEQPASADVLDALHAGARGEAGAIRAAAFVADVRIETGDAIRVELEAAEGVAIQLVLPYKRSRLTRKVSYGTLSAANGVLSVARLTEILIRRYQLTGRALPSSYPAAL